MIILPCLEFFLSGASYVTYCFLLIFAFSLLFKVVRG